MISIIITAYNQREVICQAVESAMNQTHRHTEIILVDDGSTDGTKQLLQERFGASLRYVRQENRGQGAARNTGLEMARGTFVQFLDGDDLLLENKLDRQLEALEEHDDCHAIYCDYARFTDDAPDVWIEGTLKHRYRSGDLWPHLLTGNFLLSHTPLVPLEWLKRVGGFDEDRRISGCEDYELWLRLSFAGCRFAYLDEVLALYRQCEGSTSSDQTAQQKRTIRVLKKIHEYAEGMDRRHRKAVNRYISILYRQLARNQTFGYFWYLPKSLISLLR